MKVPVATVALALNLNTRLVQEDILFRTALVQRA